MKKKYFTQKCIQTLFTMILALLVGPAISFGQTCTAPNGCMETPGFLSAPASHACAGTAGAAAIFTESFDGGFGIFTEDSPPGPGTAGTNDLTVSTLGDTPSAGTGPETTPGCNGGANDGEFIFLEGSTTLAGETHCMTATIPLPAATPPALNTPYTMSFWYHMFGDNIGTLEIFVNAVSAFSVSGQQQTANCQPWLQGSIDLSALAGTSPTVQICMSEGNGAVSTFESDISIDHLQVFACAEVCELTCPGNITVDNSPGICGAFVNVNATTMGPCNNPVINDFNGTTDGSGVYPVGTTTVTFTTTDDFGTPLTCSVDVTVNDTEGPQFFGCDDVNITLDPGDCCATLYFDPTAEDNCGGTGMPTTLSTTFADNNGASGNMFDVTNLGAFPVEILSYEGNITGGATTDVSVYYTTTATTYVGNETNAGAWTLLGTADNVASLGGGTPTPFNVGAVLTLAPGQSVGLFVSDNSSDIDYTNGANIYNDGVLEINAGIGRGVNVGNPFAGGVFTPRTWNGTLVYAQLTEIDVIRTDNEPINSGDCIAVGSYTLTYEATDAFGNVGTCALNIDITEYPFATQSLNCNIDGGQVSLDPDCEAIIGADDILEGGPYGCYDNYTVQLFFDAALSQPLPAPGNVVTGANIGQTLWGMVTDPSTGNSCWGKIHIEDKHIPALDCGNYELPCSISTVPGTVIPAGTATQSATDAGSWASTGDIDNTFGINGLGTVTDVDVAVDISHTWVGDVNVEVTSPSGTTVVLFSGQCGNTDDIDALFNDEAAAPFACGGGTIPEIGGELQPQNPLSAFDGEPAFGDWIVNVSDNVAGDGGNINNLTLTVAYTAATPVQFPIATPPATIFQTNAQLGSQEYTARNFDGCGDAILAYSDWIDDIDCIIDPTNPYTKVIYRTWTATDGSGNATQCEDTIGLLRATLADLVTPPNWNDDPAENASLLCDDKETEPANQFCGTVVGWNALDSGPYAGHPSPLDELYPCGNVKWFGTGVPGGISCGNINFTYEDIRINICQDGSSEGCYKIKRDWTILDWCNGDFTTYSQFIKVADKEGPTITDIVDATISVAAWECEATYYVPEPWIMDNCSDIDGLYTVTATAGKVDYLASIGRYVITELPLGTFQLKVRSLDCCGNATEVEVDITVEDLVPPYVTCEVYRTTSVTIDGTSKIYATAFDDGSYDACGPVYFKVIRMEDLLGTDDGSNSNQTATDCDLINGDDNLTRFGNQIYFDDYVKYCCEDIGIAGLQAKLRVFDRDPGAGPINPNRMRPGGDLYGHYNDCWSNVTVEDKLAPFISCPDDITVSCDFWFDMNDLNSTFGTVVDNQADVEYIVINDRWCNADLNDPNGMGNPQYDPANPEATYAKSVGSDGLAGDNCAVTITENVVDNLVCGQGTITRIFTATDPDGRTASCVQRIRIVDCDPYYINDTNCFNFDPFDGVRWPCNFNASSCGQDTDPSVAGEPQIFNEDNCSQVTVTYDDEEFPVVPDACFKIKRIWTVTDWCNFDEFDSDNNDVFDTTDDGVIIGQWEYVQYIKVLNSTVPEFGSCDDVDICGYNADCTVSAALSNTVSDDCTPENLLVVDFKIDLDNDGTYDMIGSNVSPYPYPNPMGLPILPVSYTDIGGGEYEITIASQDFPVGTHRILWSAEDKCSNVGTCEYLFDAQDCAKPTPKAFHGLAVDIQPVTNQVVVTAPMMDAGSFDNCCLADNPFRIATPSGGPNQTTPPNSTQVVFGCSQLGTQSVDLWVQDCNGNWDYVISYVNVQNNMGACILPGANISGTVENENGAAVNEVSVALTGNGTSMPVFTTSTNGAYAFNDLATNMNYVVTPEKDVDYRNGISTLDIVFISRHLIGLEVLDSPYKLIAADVDNSENVSTLDMIALQRLILYIDTEFANNTSWRFVESAHTFDTPTNPWSTSFPEVFAVNGLTVDQVSDFVAVKVGDVNGNASTDATAGAGSRSFNGDLNFQLEDASMVAGEEYTVDFKASDFASVMGYQFTLNFDINAVEIVDVATGSVDANFGLSMIDEGVITTNWSSTEAASLANDAVVFSVTVKAKSAAQLSKSVNVNSRYTVAEAYNQNLELMNIGLNFNKGEVATLSNNFDLYQNQPNPFKDATVIGFNLPEAGSATVSIYDVSGKVLKLIEGDFAKGYNQVSVTRSELAGSGVLYYQLDLSADQAGTENDSATMKMIIVD